ncbi:MAG: ubiquinone/menaquinone biosynthesis methyltransferase [Leptospiraceae bacterium]|nr:ubiquinone/menaquinone biosynthesis methyltransferase [Leptospiraceae bacterium]
MKAGHSYQLPDKSIRHDYIQRNFNEIAHKYDLFNDLITFGMHRLWKKRLVALCRLEQFSEARALDLCCGSGDISLYLARLPHKNLELHSLDFSSEMLRILQARIAAWRQKHPGRSFHEPQIRQGDASDLSAFPDNSLQAITISFGLRNVQRRAECLREAWRTLAPGGRFLILDVGRVRPALIAWFHAVFFKTIVPWIGYLVHGSRHEMYAYLPASAEEYPDQQTLARELGQAGFTSVHIENRLFGSAAIHIATKTSPAHQ